MALSYLLSVLPVEVAEVSGYTPASHVDHAHNLQTSITIHIQETYRVK